VMKRGIGVACFAVALAAVLGAGAAIGAAVGPTPSKAPMMEPAPIGGGVVSAADGYRLVPGARVLPAAGGAFRFVIDGPDGTPLHRFTPVHDRELHLIVANRELTIFHHVHPKRDDQGQPRLGLDYTIAAIPLAASGLLNPLIAAGVMALSSVLVVSKQPPHATLPWPSGLIARSQVGRDPAHADVGRQVCSTPGLARPSKCLARASRQVELRLVHHGQGVIIIR
jgi:hypothetical protein